MGSIRPAFFKFITSLAQLEIPCGFHQTFPPHVILRDRDANIWRVKVKNVGGKWFFQNGWVKFVKDNSIELEDMIVCEYVDEYLYDVTIYGHSGCEKIFFGHDENYDADDEKEDIEQVTHDDIGCSTKINRRSRCYGEDVFEAGLAPLPSNPYFVTKINPKRRTELFIPVNFVNDHKDLNLPEEMKVIDPKDREYWLSYVKWSDGRIFYRGSDWDALHRLNKVNEDDVCICEFIQKPESQDLHIKVDFVRGSQHGSNGDKNKLSSKRARLN
ncbi:hypothetical protein ACJIZ3_004082 [Penstemon smallii]|uniref:TF-B3 domain-containing protein n=1 Tax=Penstemon smallii TaxID=265156 RepID=A0ABD3S169_9LAMI